MSLDLHQQIADLAEEIATDEIRLHRLRVALIQKLDEARKIVELGG